LETQVITCSCNGTVAEVDLIPHGQTNQQTIVLKDDALCRRGLSDFLEKTRAAVQSGAPVVVTCTAEAPLFSRAAPEYAELRFVNIREHAGWGSEGSSAKAKISALIAAAAAAVIPDLPSVSYVSAGKTLVIADEQWPQASQWAEHLASMGNVEVSLLWLGAASSSDIPRFSSSGSATQRKVVALSGADLALEGWLGSFKAKWTQTNPIDWEACVGCGACARACPEGAISEQLQVNLASCKSHRSCVSACDTAGAIDFSRLNTLRSAEFDAVLDFRRKPAFVRDAPQGYFWAGQDSSRQIAQIFEVIQSVGEFEKPKYFDYQAKSCAHSRNQKTACTKCIDACSTGAIVSVGDQIKVEPHLCMGCGACSTVCPTGAIRFQAPSSNEIGKRLRVLLSSYRAGNGALPIVMFFDRRHGSVPFEVPQLAMPKDFKGLPARVIPFEVEHVGSVGLEVLLAAKAYGAAKAYLLAGKDFDQGYSEALTMQALYGQEILNGMGYAGEHFSLVDGGSPERFFEEIWSKSRDKSAALVNVPGGFELPKDKREALSFAIDYLLENKPVAALALDLISLSKGAPFGSISVNATSCTLCMACTGVCPKSALLDGQDKPQLRFIEANCVQCGLCVETCPESAITLVPQLNRDATTKAPKVVSETEPMNCTSCGKAFGTKQMVQAMLAKLSGHSMFSGDGLKRLSMCADCRVVDLIKNPVDGSIHDYMAQSNGSVTALTRNKGPNQ
jgi:ferredoxin